MSGILTTSQAAEDLHVSRKTLLGYARRRLIVYMRHPSGQFHFRQSALDLFQAKCTVKNSARCAQAVPRG